MPECSSLSASSDISILHHEIFDIEDRAFELHPLPDYMENLLICNE